MQSSRVHLQLKITSLLVLPRWQGRDIMDCIKISKRYINKLKKDLDLHKASGPNGISPCVLKGLQETLDRPHKVLSILLRRNRYLRQWKTANDITVYKRGNKENELIYRPLPLRITTCKL